MLSVEYTNESVLQREAEFVGSHGDCRSSIPEAENFERRSDSTEGTKTAGDRLYLSA